MKFFLLLGSPWTIDRPVPISPLLIYGVQTQTILPEAKDSLAKLGPWNIRSVDMDIEFSIHVYTRHDDKYKFLTFPPIFRGLLYIKFKIYNKIN